MGTVELSIELLDELEERWRRQRASVIEHLRPGATEDAIRSALATCDLDPPRELVTWWGWHDGAEMREITSTGLRFLSAAQAAEATARTGKAFAELWAPHGGVPKDVWDEGWLVWLLGGGADGVIDCAAGGTQPTAPVLFVDDELPLGPCRASSLGELVTWWIEAIDVGAVYYEARIDGWQTTPELLPVERRETGLV